MRGKLDAFLEVRLKSSKEKINKEGSEGILSKEECEEKVVSSSGDSVDIMIGYVRVVLYKNHIL